MSPAAAHQTMLLKRLMRLQRYEAYKQDGRGNDLSADDLRLIQAAIESTRREWVDTLHQGVPR